MFSLLRSGLNALVTTPLTPRDVGKNASSGSGDKGGNHVGSNVVAAGLCAIVTLAYAGSFGQLVFDGELAPYVGKGILAALVSSVAVLFVLSWCSSLRFSVGGPDSNPSAVLAVTLASLVQQVAVSSGSSSRELVPTVMMFVFVSAFGCGLIVWLLGARRWGRYVRYIPHPVVGGFLAGTGFLLVAGAFKMLTGAPLDLQSIGLLGNVHPLGGVTAVTVAALLVVLSRRAKHYLVIPTVILGAVLAFHLVRASVGIDLESARRLGFLLPGLELGAWHSMVSLPFGDIRWDLVLLHAKDFGAMTVVVIVTALLNTTSLELATGKDTDADRELRAIGMSNMLAGFFGGMVACNSFNRSFLNWRAGATSRWSARLCAIIVVVIMAVAPGSVGLLPRPVLTGLILFLGTSLLITWVFDARRTLVRIDHAVVLAILAIVVGFGIVAGVVSGIFIACVSFAVTLSRSPNVRHAFTAQNRRANVERTPRQLTRLRTEGAALRGYTLQGVLFFGTAIRLLDEIRVALGDTRIVLLDFRLIQGADGSAIVVLKRVQMVCRDAGVQLVLTGVNPRMAAMLAAGGFDLKASNVRRFADLDRGLEWAEEIILGANDTPESLTDVLDGALTRVGTRMLMELGEHRRVAAGQVVVRQGEASEELIFVISGRIQVLLPLSTPDIEESKRLRTYGPGTVVGEMGFFSGEPRSADIVAQVDAEILYISRECNARIENLHPELARAIHRHVINTLAQRLRSANDEIRLLL